MPKTPINYAPIKQSTRTRPPSDSGSFFFLVRFLMIPCVYFSTVDFFRLFIVVKKILVFPIISGVILSFLIYLAWLHRFNISYMYFPAVFTLLCIPLSFRNMKWIDMGLNSSYATFTKRVFTISFLLPSSSFNFFSSSRYIIIEILYIYGFLTLWLNLIVCLLFPFSIYFFFQQSWNVFGSPAQLRVP